MDTFFTDQCADILVWQAAEFFLQSSIEREQGLVTAAQCDQGHAVDWYGCQTWRGRIIAADDHREEPDKMPALSLLDTVLGKLDDCAAKLDDLLAKIENMK